MDFNFSRERGHLPTSEFNNHPKHYFYSSNEPDLARSYRNAVMPVKPPPSRGVLFPPSTSQLQNNGQADFTITSQTVFGTVTQIYDIFGIIGENHILFSLKTVSGPIIPKIGDKVVAEAFPVSGMPFKLNATKESEEFESVPCNVIPIVAKKQDDHTSPTPILPRLSKQEQRDEEKKAVKKKREHLKKLAKLEQAQLEALLVLKKESLKVSGVAAGEKKSAAVEYAAKSNCSSGRKKLSKLQEKMKREIADKEKTMAQLRLEKVTDNRQGANKKKVKSLWKEWAKRGEGSTWKSRINSKKTS